MRVTCPHAAECPGCPLILLDYPEQLEAKRRALGAAVRPFPELSECPIAEVVGADPIVDYRTRAKFVVAGAHVGLFGRGSHQVLDLPGCRVLGPEVRAAVSAVRALLPLGVPLRALDVRAAGGGALVTLVVPTGTSGQAVRAAARVVSAHAPAVTSIAVSERDEESAQVLGRPPSLVSGEPRVKVRIHERGPFHFATHGAFAQAHAGQQRVMLDAILDTLQRRHGRLAGLRVLELFAGSGALSLELAARKAEVVAVEAFAPAAALTREAAMEQGLSVDVLTGDATTALRRLARDRPPFDAVVVNPPRRGLDPDLRVELGRSSPALVVYMSCEAATLARDLADLARRGLRAARLAPHDMMPLTADLETLAVLAPAPLPLPLVIYRDERFLAVEKSPHEPTTPQGEHDRSLLHRVRRLEGAHEAVPVHRLDVGTSGVCLFALEPRHVEEIARGLTLGEKEYVALVRGIVRPKGSVRRALVEDGRPHDARTRYSRRAVVGGHSLLTVRPDQGRRHQIRRHLALLGHPIVGDDRYGHAPTNRHFTLGHFLDRPFLHCARIQLGPEGRGPLLVAPLAPDLQGVLARLGV